MTDTQIRTAKHIHRHRASLYRDAMIAAGLWEKNPPVGPISGIQDIILHYTQCADEHKDLLAACEAAYHMLCGAGEIDIREAEADALQKLRTAIANAKDTP